MDEELVSVPRVSLELGIGGSASGASNNALRDRSRSFVRDRSAKSFVKREQERSVRQLEQMAPMPRQVDVMADVIPLSEQDMVFSVQFSQRQNAGLSFGEFFFINCVTEWRRKYVHYAKLQRILAHLYQRQKAVPAVDAKSVVISLRVIDSQDPDAAAFFGLLASELDKVEEFYQDQRRYFHARLAEMCKQIRKCASSKSDAEKPVDVVDPTASFASVSRYMHELREKRQLQLAIDSFKVAISEFLRGLKMLQSYCSMNKLALVHLINSYEGLAEKFDTLPHIGNDIRALMDRTTFGSAGREIAQMTSEIEEVFTETFFPQRSSVHAAVAPVELKRKYQRAMFVIGLCAGLVAAAVGLIIFLLATTPDVYALPAWNSTYYIFRGVFLILLMVFYTGLNMYGWKISLINFRFIAEIDRLRISHHLLHLFVAPLVIVMLLLFVLYLTAARGDYVSVLPVRYFAFILFVSYLGILLCPFNVFLRNTRWWILCKSARIVCAPFFPVRFVDFFLADQFTSMVMVLYDLVFGFCYCLVDVWTDTGMCVAAAPTMRLCLAGLPGLWRLLQCLRRFRDTGDWVNISNAFKYSSGLMVVLFSGLARGLDPSGAQGINVWRALLIVASVGATGFLMYWDLKRDFGFFQPGSKHRFLRNELLYQRRWVYYAIIPTDLVLRLAWVFTIAPASFGISIPSDLFLFCLAVADMTRRFLWNFFRMENESATNCGRFRAVNDVPLPFEEEATEAAAPSATTVERLIPVPGESEHAAMLDAGAEELTAFLDQFEKDAAPPLDAEAQQRGGERLDEGEEIGTSPRGEAAHSLGQALGKEEEETDDSAVEMELKTPLPSQSVPSVDLNLFARTSPSRLSASKSKSSHSSTSSSEESSKGKRSISPPVSRDADAVVISIEPRSASVPPGRGATASVSSSSSSSSSSSEDEM
jgi:hypothetical protein